MDAAKTSRVQLTDRLLKPSTLCERLDRGKTWLWDKVKNDPIFPKPVYRDGMCFFIERELNRFLASFEDQSSDRAGRTRRERLAA
jgi:predicted DNA-binding transcriptional regulator AlpA